ncbi:MAG: hypothetical protein AABN95_16930 [Acidobacteriota bacterium]
MRRFLMAVALACVVSSPALAGIIHSTDAAPEPPSPAVAIVLSVISAIL